MLRICLIALVAPLLSLGCTDHDSRSVALVATPLQTNFETRSDIGTNAREHADAVVADFTGDGVPDMVVVNLTGEVELLLGVGDGTFSSVLVLTPGGKPLAVAEADLDKDKDRDLVILRTDDQAATIYLNNGIGGLTRSGDLPVGPDAVGLAVGDHNGDTIADIVVARLFSPDLVLFSGTGGGNFVPAPGLSLPGGGEPIAVTLGEVSGDTMNDLVVCDRAKDRILIYRGVAFGLDAVPVALPIQGQPVAVSIGDLSGDGENDIAVSPIDMDHVAVITSWNDTGTSVGFTAELDGAPTNSLIADVTGDGVQDLVVAVGEQSRIAVFRGRAGGGLLGEMQMDTYAWPFRPRTADVNLDGRPDLVVLVGRGDQFSLFLGREGGGLRGARNHATTHADRLMALATADLDGDGNAEAIVSGPDSTFLSFMNPLLSEFQEFDLEEGSTLDIGRPVRNVVPADLNDDGKTDLVVAVDGGVKIVRNDSTIGVFDFELEPLDPTEVLAPGLGPFEVTVRDMNDDGLPDLIIVDFYAEKVFLLRATSAFFEYEAQPITVDAIGEPIGLVADDFNGDDVPDVAVSLRKFAMISVYINLGDGTLIHSLDLPVREAPNYIRCADFDGNGRTDMVVSNGADESISVLFAQPGLSFSVVSFTAGETPTALMARDLNEDGFPDILVNSLVGADFRVLLGDGNGTFPDRMQFAGLRGVASASLADLTGDELPDLLMVSLVSSRVSLYENVSTR